MRLIYKMQIKLLIKIHFHSSDYASWLNAESITFDGGEFRSLAGEFNQLKNVPEEMWDAMEQMIRGSNKKSKM